MVKNLTTSSMAVAKKRTDNSFKLPFGYSSYTQHLQRFAHLL